MFVKNLLRTHLVGQLRYDIGPEEKIQNVCKEWDLGLAHFHWSDQPPVLGEVRCGHALAEWKRPVNWFKVIAVPLYNIESIKDVTDLMDRVRAAEVPASTEGQP